MSALSIPITRFGDRRSVELHIVRDGEISASQRRHQHARATARRQSWGTARTCAALGSVVTVFTMAMVTIVQAFLAVPNLPLP